MSTTFSDKLGAGAQRIRALQALVERHPEAFADAYSYTIEADQTRVLFINSKRTDWSDVPRTLGGKWRRESSASLFGFYDWCGSVDDIELIVCQAERRQPVPDEPFPVEVPA